MQREFHPSSKEDQEMCLICLQKRKKGVKDKGYQVVQRYTCFMHFILCFHLSST